MANASRFLVERVRASNLLKALFAYQKTTTAKTIQKKCINLHCSKKQKMKQRNTIIKFGEDVEGYAIPVLNEREIRASAGILFLILFISVMLILFKQDFLLVKYVIVVFLT